jgi:gliding motility-associated-like protein
MRKFLLLSFIIIPLLSVASHIAGTDMQYRYIGDSTGISNHYEILFRFYRDNRGIPAPNMITLNVQSSCYPSRTLNLPFDPLVTQGQIAPTLFDCVEPQNGVVVSELYVYRNTIILNGTCPDWRFSYTCSSCRNPSTNSPANQTYFIQVELNNTLGNNTSPLFVSEPVRAFCINRLFNWAQNVQEPNGDSLFFNLVQPLTNVGAPIAWLSPYNHLQPFPTLSPLIVNNSNGVFNFTLTSTGTFVCAISVDEYRFDSINNGWVKIGTSVRDMQITVAPSCSQFAQRGVFINPTFGYVDTATGLTTVDYSCNDSLITLLFGVAIDCMSISKDGSDFRLTDPNGNPVPIKSLIPNCDNDNSTRTIMVDLYRSLRVNGRYYLYSKVGTDGNTLFNKCGFNMSEFDTIAINVSGCFEPQLNMENVTIFENQYPIAQWAVDTSTFPVADFNAYEVFRSDAGGPFTMVGTVTNVMQWEFEDLTGVPTVMLNNYEYRIRPVIKGENFSETRSIVSILLQSDSTNRNEFNIYWNNYNGWSNPEYQIMLGIWDGTSYVFNLHNQPGSITSQNSYRFVKPNQIGQHVVRIDAYNNLNNTWIASSNWIFFYVLEQEFTNVEIIIPNVITPNGDGINDDLKIAGIETYSNVSITIVNRWGQMVYKSYNYSNNKPWDGKSQSGDNLADGVYFYVLKSLDREGIEREYIGNITIISDR